MVPRLDNQKVLQWRWGLDLLQIHVGISSAWLLGAQEFVSTYELFISIGGHQPKLAGREGWGGRLPEP